MAITTNSYTGDGSTTVYSISFPYVKTADVKATLDGSATTAFTVTGTNLTFTSAPANGVAIKLFRETNNETILASFQSGSALRAVDMNTNFTQSLYVSQETTTTAGDAVTTANSAVTTANSAVTTANSAVTTANQSISDASNAVTTSNNAVTTANNAVTTANSAVTTANTASTTASAAVTTANSAETKADNAVSTANTASTTASNAVTTANSAVTTANSAVTTANSAVSTANTASTNASNAVTTANNAQTAVNNAAIFVIVNNVAGIPGSPSDQDRIEITDSSNVQSSSVVAGLPVGFVGDSGLFVRLKYQTSNNKWNFVQYGANDIDSRYVRYYSNNVGIGTASPQEKLHVSGTSDFVVDTDDSILRFGSYGEHDIAIVTGRNTATGSSRVIIENANGEAARIDSLGNVGIGTTSATNIGGYTGLSINNATNGGFVDLMSNGSPAFRLLTNGAQCNIESRTSIPLVFFTNAAERMRIDSSGNVGINLTPSGSSKLQVNGSMRFGGSGTATDSTNPIIYRVSGQDSLAFASGNTERMRIDSSGNLIVGTSSTVNPTLRILGSSTDNSFIQFADGDSNSIGQIQYSHASNALITAVNGSERMRIDSSGNVGIGTTSPSGKLEVKGAGFVSTQISSDSTSETQFRFATNTAARISNQANTALIFDTNATERMRIDSSGVLRIGGTDTYNGSDKLTLVNNSGNCSLTIDSTSSGESSVFFADGTTGNEAYRGYLQYQHSIDALLIGVAGSERIRIDSSGNLLVKTGEIDLQGGNKTIKASAGFLQVGTSGSHHTAFITGGSERMRIDSNGNVGIGTSSPNNYNNYTTLTLNDTTGGEIDFESNGTLVSEIYSSASNGLSINTRTAVPIRFGTNASGNRLVITSTGNAEFNGSATFAGAVDVGTFSAGTSGIRLTNSGTIYIGGTGNNAALNIGSSAAVIDYDGSALFDDTVRSNEGYTVYPPSDSNYSFATRNAANNTWSAYITAAGAGNFAGRIDSGSIIKSTSDSGFVSKPVSSGAQFAFRATDTNDNAKVTIFSDGSATFTNSLYVGGVHNGNRTFFVQNTGHATINTGSTGSTKVFTVKTGAGSGEVASIRADGRALVGLTTPVADGYLEVKADSDRVNTLVLWGQDTLSEYLGLGISSNGPTITAGGAGSTSSSLIFRTAFSGSEEERMRIQNDGEIIIKAPKRGITQDGDFTLANGSDTTIDIGEAGTFQIAVKTHTNHPSGNDDHKGALFFACKAMNQVIKLADPGSHFDHNQTTLNTGKINVATGLNSSSVTITNKTGYEVVLVVGKSILE